MERWVVWLLDTQTVYSKYSGYHAFPRLASFRVFAQKKRRQQRRRCHPKLLVHLISYISHLQSPIFHLPSPSPIPIPNPQKDNQPHNRITNKLSIHPSKTSKDHELPTFPSRSLQSHLYYHFKFSISIAQLPRTYLISYFLVIFDSA